MDSKFIQIQTTFPQAADAKAVAKRLVEERRVACAQIVDGIESCYQWKGRLEIATEVLLLAKTRAAFFDEIVAEISRTHPYECPQIVAVPLDFVSPSYAAWLDAEIRAESGKNS